MNLFVYNFIGLADQGSGVAARKKEMSKGLSFYKERLGLEFERVDGKPWSLRMII